MDGKRSDNTRQGEALCRRVRRWLEGACAAAVCLSAQTTCAQLLPPVADDWARGGLTGVAGWTASSNNAGRVTLLPGDTVDAFDLSTGYSSNLGTFFRGNLYHADVVTTLLGHEFYLSNATPAEITFCVYESESGNTNGPFARVDAATVYAPAGTGFVSSGQRGVPLRIDHFYAIGVAVKEAASYQWLTALALPADCGKLTCVQGVRLDSLPADAVASFTLNDSPYRQRLRLADGYDPVPSKGTSTSPTTPTGYMRGNLLAPTNNTWLLGHGLQVARTTAKTINLFVYESATRIGTYTRVDLQTVTVPAATNYVSVSTQLPLTAGRFYLVGGHCASSYTLEYDDNYYATPKSFDWGKALEGFSQSGSPPATVTKAAATNETVYSACFIVGDRPAVRMDTSSVSMSTNSMTVLVNAAGYSDLTLAFDYRESSDESQDGDGVFASANGTTFTRVLVVDGTTTWKHYETNIIALAQAVGVSTAGNLHIRLQQMDENPWPTDGREFANIRVFAKPDLAWQALEATQTNYLFRGSVAKPFNLTGTIRLAGGTNDVSGRGVSVSHQLIDAQGTVQTTATPYTADIPVLGHLHDAFTSSFTVPAGTILTQSYYRVDATLDSTNALAEGRENNNVTSTPGFLVNHYSGSLFFSNTAVAITLSGWNFQTNYGGSPIYHLITGTGTLAGHTFGFTNLMVRKRMSTCDYVIDPDETQHFVLPGHIGTTGTVSGIRFTYDGDVNIGRNGVSTLATVFLPAGCAFTGGPDNPWGRPTLETDGELQLGADLLPTGLVNLHPVIESYTHFFEESKPLYFSVTNITWNPGAGTFSLLVNGVAYAHDGAMDALDALAKTDQIASSNAVRRTNDGYYRSVTNATTLTLSRDAHGAAQLSFAVDIATNTFRTHFPYDVALGWDGQGTLTITNDRPDVSQSVCKLSGGRDFSVSYSTGVPGACAGGTNALSLSCRNDASAFYFTRDGGLFVPCGFTGGPADLRWGKNPSKDEYAQRALGFTDGVLHVPGHFLCVDDCPVPLSDDDTPGALLLTAVGGAGDELTRPLGAGYSDGDGNYAGVTVQRQDPACVGETRVGGSSLFGPYALAPACKLYVRHSGVSGTHVADASFNPPSGTLYGYPFDFATFAFAYLSNVNRDSRTSGGLTVPAPSGFGIDFAELRLNGFGDVESAVPADPKDEITLTYWPAKLLPSSLQFTSQDACQVGGKILTMDVSTKVASIPERLFGRLGFLSSGNLSSTADAGAVCDSRLALPRTVTLPGPNSSRYTLRPVGKAYLNDFRQRGDLSANGDGLLTFMGELDVPFFENLLVQAFTGARPIGTPPTYLVGGWPTKGWMIGGQTPFTGAAFDTNNAAHPTGTGKPSFKDYLAGSDSDYIPRARREWMAGIGFDIGVRWDHTTRSFRSPAPKSSDLIVLQTEYNVPQLNAERAEITFGMQYGEMPALNLSSVLFNAVDEATGISQLLTDTVGNVIADALDSGVGALDKLTATDPTDMLGNTLADQLDPFVDTLYIGLTNAYARGESVTNVIVRHVRGGLGEPAHTLRELLGTLADGDAQVGAGLGIAEELQGRLETTIGMLDAVAVGVYDPDLDMTLCLLDQDGDGNFTWLEALANLLLLFAMPALDDGGGALAESIGEIMDTLKPTLETARETLSEVRGQLENTRAALDSAGEFRDELKDLLDGAQLDALTNAVIARLEGELATLGNAFSPRANYTPAELKARLRGALLDTLREASPIAQVQRAVRARMVDVDRQVRDGVDSVMGQINQAMRDALSEVVGSLDTSLSGMSGALSDVIGTGQIEGYAHIQGDSLDKLRLDLAMQLKVPEEMQFAGFLELNNEQTSTSGGCAFGEGSTYKVTLGANDVSCNWLGSDLRINCSCFFTLNNGEPKGMGGGLELVGGSIKFGTLEAQRFAAAVAFGQLENYLAASARLVMNGSTVIEGGLFFGRTCNITPLLIVDPEAETVLGKPPFTGAYVYGEGWIPIYDYGCTFRIRAGAGFGVFYFVEGPTYGMRALLGATGEALCVFSVSGVVELRGVKQGDVFRATGKGRFKGQVGSCPFCLKFGKTVKITYDDGEWDADY